MNIILLMSGGFGRRFGGDVPKQYTNLNGKPVIEYVLEASLKAQKADKIVVVMDKHYKDISPLLQNHKICIVPNGETRYASLKNGLEYIHKHFKCHGVIIVDAVAPFIYSELIDDYLSKLEEYDIVLTGQKITGALCDFEGNKYDREEFFMSQAPEAFKFDMLYANVDYETKYQAISSLMPKTAKRYVNFNFKNNLKLTYHFELKYAEFMLDYLTKDSLQNFTSITSSSFFETNGLKQFLLRTRPKETHDWLEDVYTFYTDLVRRDGQFKNISLNQSSNYGLVILATTQENYEYVLKINPPFLGRYATEKKAYQTFSSTWMCDLLDFDDANNALYLKKLEPIDEHIFDDNLRLIDFYNKVFGHTVAYDKKEHAMFEKIIDNLHHKLKFIDELPKFQDEYRQLLKKAIKYYKVFDEKDLKLIHGDLRVENILQDEESYQAIDPIGYVAPIEMEPSRFIISDIYHNNHYDPIDRLQILLNFFQKWLDYDKMVYGVYIYYVMISYNSVFEYEDTKMTEYYLRVIHDIETKVISKLTK